MSAMAFSSGEEIPAKSWQLRSALTIPICLSSAKVVIMPAKDLIILAPEVNNPTGALAAFDLRGKTLAAEQLDERRWQKRRDDDDSLARLERLDTLENLGQRLGPALQYWTHIETL